MSESVRSNPLGYEKLPRLLRKFAIPSIIAMLVSSLYNIVDQIFIGQSVGYLGNAATNVAYPMTTICLAIALLIGIGGAATFSLELGAGHPDEAVQCVSNVFWCGLLFGGAFAIIVELFLQPLLVAFGATETVMPYAISYVRITSIGMPFLILTNSLCSLIRADGRPNSSMACMVVGAVANTILDPIFIFVLDLGIAGAALATTLSQILSFFLVVRHLFHFQSVQLGRNFFHPNWKKAVRMASLGLSNSLNQVAMTFLQVVMNHSLTYYGALSAYGSDIPLSGAGIVMKVNSIIIGIMVGLCQGAQPITSFNYGAKQYDRVKKIYRLTVFCGIVISTIAAIFCQLFPSTIIGLFGTADNPLYMEFTVRFMRIFLLMMFINGVQQISSNFFSAIGKPLKGVLLSLSRQILILIPLMLIFPLIWGLDGILFAAPVADTAAFVLSIALIRREFHKISKLEALSET